MRPFGSEEGPGRRAPGEGGLLERCRHVIVALLLGMVFAISLWTSLEESPTIDEPYHLYSGYACLRFGDLSLNPEHSPLVKEISALPLLFSSLNYVEAPPWSMPPR